MTVRIEESVVNESRHDHRPTIGTASTTRVYPTLYTAELAGRILREVAGGRSLHDLCRDQGIPAYSTIQGWVKRDRDGFAVRFARARETGRTGRGAATIYTEEIAERILHELSRGRPLCDFSLDDGMPAASTVKLWVSEDRNGFAACYKRARETGRPPQGGRVTLYTHELAEQLLDELAEGRTLSDVCGDPGMPDRTTVRLWVKQDREGFAARYYEARGFGFYTMADAIIDIADDGHADWIRRRRKDGSIEAVFDHQHLKRCRLRIDARRWILAYALPKIFGDCPESAARHDPGPLGFRAGADHAKECAARLLAP
jgi:hypothetical protein